MPHDDERHDGKAVEPKVTGATREVYLRSRLTFTIEPGPDEIPAIPFSAEGMSPGQRCAALLGKPNLADESRIPNNGHVL